ncbi:hypothetical protein CaCOL14_012547 [Colletotrichum acutatum]
MITEPDAPSFKANHLNRPNMSQPTESYQPTGRSNITASHLTASFLDPENDRQSRIIDIIDQLRALKIDRTIPLPQLIVCGDQSSGKSSVLGAITGIPFPSGENLCTRYVTKVRLDYSKTTLIEVDIEPAEHRNAAEKERLKEFSRKESADGRDSRDLLNQCITDAHNAICDGSTETSPIKDDVLSIRITGPNRRALQLVDLPGLIKFDSTRSGIVKKIEDMVRSYMAMKQSTILAVVPGNNDSTTPLFSPFARNTILKAIEPSVS